MLGNISQGFGSSPPPTVPEEDPGDVGIAGRVIIWTLAIVIYGGGLAGWFASMEAVRPVTENALSTFRMLADSSGDETAIAADEELAEEAPAPVPPPPASKPEKSGSFWGRSATGGWPSIKVIGVMTQQGSKTVILDKDIVAEGKSSRDVRVVKIETSRVLLEFGGEQKWVPVGSLTDKESE